MRILWNKKPICGILSYIMGKNVLLTIEYDGTGFSGWQRQPEARTVQGTVEKVLTDLIGEPVTVEGVSRTDAGVHARDQKAVFGADLRIPVENLAKVMNARLQGRPEARSENDDVRILSAEEVPDGFRVREHVAGKTYRYSIRNAVDMPVFDRNYRYLVKPDLDAAKMREAAECIKGTHDFVCFQAAGGEPGKTTVRTISAIDIREVPVQSTEPDGDAGRDMFIDISGDGFLYNMVRIITGTLVEVGLGKREPAELGEIIESRDRTQAGHTAPPQGLCLMKVFLDGDEKASALPKSR